MARASGHFADSIEPLRTAFAGIIPRERIRVFELPGTVAEANLSNTWRAQAAESGAGEISRRPPARHCAYRNDV
jgi:hypothetical protein